jgi:hypothetical protein
MMSLTKQLYFDQIEADAPETRIANVNRISRLRCV